MFQPAAGWITTLNCIEFSLWYFHWFPLVRLGPIHHVCNTVLIAPASCTGNIRNIATFYHGPIPSLGQPHLECRSRPFPEYPCHSPTWAEVIQGISLQSIGPYSYPPWNEGAKATQTTHSQSQSVNSLQPPWMKAKLLCQAPDHHWSSLLRSETMPVTTYYNYNISLFPSPFQAWKRSHLCRPSLAASLFALAVLATYFTARVCSSVKTWAALSSLAGYWEKMAVGRTLQFCNYIH